MAEISEAPPSHPQWNLLLDYGEIYALFDMLDKAIPWQNTLVETALLIGEKRTRVQEDNVQRCNAIRQELFKVLHG